MPRLRRESGEKLFGRNIFRDGKNGEKVQRELQELLGVQIT